MLESIEPALLTAIVGAGPSLGDRDAPPPSDNSWEAPMRRHTFAPDGLSATIDPGMTMKPANPDVDFGMWKLPYEGAGSQSQIDL